MLSSFLLMIQFTKCGICGVLNKIFFEIDERDLFDAKIPYNTNIEIYPIKNAEKKGVKYISLLLTEDILANKLIKLDKAMKKQHGRKNLAVLSFSQDKMLGEDQIRSLFQKNVAFNLFIDEIGRKNFYFDLKKSKIHFWIFFRSSLVQIQTFVCLNYWSSQKNLRDTF